MTTIHSIKTLAQFWDAVAAGDKTFEVRLNDRAFQKGDILHLHRTDQGGFYRSNYDYNNSDTIELTISYILQGGQFGIEPAYCVIGFRKVTVL